MPVTVHIQNIWNGGKESHLYENATQFSFNGQSKTFQIQTKNRKVVAVYGEHEFSYLTLEDPKIISSDPPPKPVKLD